MHACDMRKKFDRSLEIDAASRASIASMVGTHSTPYAADETRDLSGGLELFDMFEGAGGKEVKLASPLTRAQIAHKRVESRAYGWSTTTVRAR